MHPDQQLQRALQQRQAGNPAAAEQTLRQILAQHPHHAPTLHALGNLFKSQKRLDEAITAYELALAQNPNQLELHGALGTTLFEANRPDEAAAAFDKALALAGTPQYMQPHLAQYHFQFGKLLQSISQFQRAAECFRRTTQLAPDRPEPCQSLGMVYEILGQKSDAILQYKRALALGATNPEAHFQMTGLIGENFPPQQPPDSVIKLFDNLAPGFDAHLKKLNYAAPQLLYESLRNFHADNPNPNFGDIVDLGCGTGLCGELLKPHAKSLTGIDLSPNMLAEATKKNLYNRLLQSEITAALSPFSAAFDLAISADVFIYIGDLHSLFAATARALRPNALFAFSIETTDKADYLLLPTRRYAQSLAYIHSLAAAHHFIEVSSHPAIIRDEIPDPCPGAVIVLQKNPTA